jgi:hypothetical protein
VWSKRQRIVDRCASGSRREDLIYKWWPQGVVVPHDGIKDAGFVDRVLDVPQIRISDKVLGWRRGTDVVVCAYEHEVVDVAVAPAPHKGDANSANLEDWQKSMSLTTKKEEKGAFGMHCCCERLEFVCSQFCSHPFRRVRYQTPTQCSTRRQRRN